MEYHFIDVGGIKTRYVKLGSSKNNLPLLLVHGWGCSIETVRGPAEKLSQSYQVFAVDLPGHGQTDLPKEIWGTGDYAIFLGKFIDAAGMGKCNALGHSVGGRFLSFLAAIEPSKLNRLVLAGASGIKPKRKPKYYFKVSLAKIGKFAAKYLGSVGVKLKEKIYSKIASADYRSAGELRLSFIKIINEDIRDKFKDIKSETLLLWGENDEESPVTSAQIFKNLISNSQLVVLKNAGHYSFLDQPERFNLEVKKFLRE